MEKIRCTIVKWTNQHVVTESSGHYITDETSVDETYMDTTIMHPIFKFVFPAVCIPSCLSSRLFVFQAVCIPSCPSAFPTAQLMHCYFLTNTIPNYMYSKLFLSNSFFVFQVVFLMTAFCGWPFRYCFVNHFVCSVLSKLFVFQAVFSLTVALFSK